MFWQLVGPLLLKFADWFFSDLSKREKWKRAIEAQMSYLDKNAAEAAKLREQYAKMEQRLQEIEQQKGLKNGDNKGNA